MNFTLSEEQLMIKEAASEYAQRNLIKDVIERDTNAIFPKDHIKKMAELGFLGMPVKENYGGVGLKTLSQVIAIEEIAKVDSSVAVIMSVHNSLVAYGIQKFGTKAQKERYLPSLAAGEYIGAFLLSEPEAGSDATSQKTTAIDRGDHYLINGTKSWITSANSASVYILIAKTHDDKGIKGINAFIVDRHSEGISLGKHEDKMGMRSSDTHSVMFTDVKIPKTNRIGKDGTGFYFAMKVLENGRIGIAAQALGIAAGAYELALKYAKERKTFGKEIIAHQGIGFKLAEMLAQVEAARLMVYKAAWLKDHRKPFGLEASMAKLFASEIAMKVTTEAVQIHGGYGYVKEYHVERLMRDAKLTQIYEGSSEIQKLIISRKLEKE